MNYSRRHIGRELYVLSDSIRKRHYKQEKKKLKRKMGKYYLKKGTLLFHGTLDNTLLGSMDSFEGMYFTPDIELSISYIFELAYMKAVHDIIDSSLEWSSKEEILSSDENIISKITNRYGFIEVFSVSHDMLVYPIPQRGEHLPAGEYGYMVPAIQPQRTINYCSSGLFGLYTEVYIPGSFFHTLEHVDTLKVSIDQLKHHRCEDEWDPRESITKLNNS